MPKTPATALPYTVELTDWTRDVAAIQRVRRAVFIEEQRIDEREEWDDLDPVVTHALCYAGSASTNRDPVGTGRLEPTGKIGRVAVLPQYRGTGAGVAIMHRLMDLAAERGFHEVYLNAQTSARGFYERLGFRTDGPEFDEVGIPHQRMRRAVEKRDGISAGDDGHAQHPGEPR
ncbi:MAG TPA: GNAT family N-acetyltransferase [Steroidobacteraceae bacterium]|nr:GNAT family N-acetyltransferase [Steroidobacteraceae bacterium]